MDPMLMCCKTLLVDEKQLGKASVLLALPLKLTFVWPQFMYDG
jgi:hypothetical protein